MKELEKYSIIELKALAYDEISKLEISKQNLFILNEEIKSREENKNNNLK